MTPGPFPWQPLTQAPAGVGPLAFLLAGIGVACLTAALGRRPRPALAVLGIVALIAAALA